MFLTLRHARGKSVTGTDGTDGVSTDEQLPVVRPPGTVTPVYPTIAYADPRRGAAGGLLYNCPPSMRVGTVCFSEPGPYREVVAASADELGPVLGVLVHKSAPTIGEVVELGYAAVFEDLEPGARYFLSQEGLLISPALEPGLLRYIHFVGYAVSRTTLRVQPDYPALKTARV